MEQTVTCQCGKRFKLPESAFGKRFRCKACGAVVSVPIPAAAEEPALEDPWELAAADAASAPALPDPEPTQAAGLSSPVSARVNLPVDLKERLKMLGFLAAGLATLAWFAGYPIYQLNQGAPHVGISLRGIVLGALLTSGALVALFLGGSVLPWKKTGPKKPLGAAEKLGIGLILLLTVLLVAAIWLYFNSQGYSIKF